MLLSIDATNGKSSRNSQRYCQLATVHLLALPEQLIEETTAQKQDQLESVEDFRRPKSVLIVSRSNGNSFEQYVVNK